MTLKDIAREAGVSTVTVSNVINGNYRKVSEDTIKRVQKIIEKYDYRPNATARSLASKQSRIIGVIIPNLGEDDDFLKSPYNAEVLGVLECSIRKQGYYMMVRSVNSCMEVLSLFASWNVDGIIFVGAFSDEAIQIQRDMKLPMIFMDTYVTDDRSEIANIGADDYKGGLLATRYLLSRGHVEIAYAGPLITSQGVINERYRGMIAALQERNMQMNPARIFEGTTDYEDGVRIGKEIAFSSESVTAVVAMSDILALGIMEGLHVSGKLVPEDISVIGYDNLTECRYSSPKLTTVDQNITGKAQKAAECLFRIIKNKEHVVINEKMDVQIIERQSVKEIRTK